MDLLDSLILGAVEGLTEFLPISSTGHLILVSELLGIPSTEFVKSFMIAVQLGAILAVVILYFKKFLDIEVIKRLIVGFIPTGIIGFTLYQLIKDYLIGNAYIVVAALFLGGIALIAFEMLHKESEEEPADIRDLPYRQVALVGLFQSIAMIPGVSRSGATIMGGMVFGLSRKTATEFSFFLAIPIMFAATGYDLLKSRDLLDWADLPMFAVGFVTAFFSALIAVKTLLRYVAGHDFRVFAWYRIVLGIVVLAYFWQVQ